VDYERGLRVPSGSLSRIAGAADTSMDWLLNDRTPKMRPDDRDWDAARPFRAIWRDPTHPAGADDDPHICSRVLYGRQRARLIVLEVPGTRRRRRVHARGGGPLPAVQIATSFARARPPM
jgi:hypothetical protein